MEKSAGKKSNDSEPRLRGTLYRGGPWEGPYRLMDTLTKLPVGIFTITAL